MFSYQQGQISKVVIELNRESELPSVKLRLHRLRGWPLVSIFSVNIQLFSTKKPIEWQLEFTNLRIMVRQNQPQYKRDYTLVTVVLSFVFGSAYTPPALNQAFPSARKIELPLEQPEQEQLQLCTCVNPSPEWIICMQCNLFI